jgi:hypothetical protein
MIARSRSVRVSVCLGFAAACSAPGLIEIDQHDDAGLSGDTGKGDEADRDRDAHIVAEPPHQPGAADQRERTDSMTISVSASRPSIKQHKDDEQRGRHNDPRRAAARSDIRIARSTGCDSRA